MNNESQTISIESVLHQATSPWLSYILAPLGYCFIGLILALRQQQFNFLHFVVLFLFFVTIYLQENSYRKLALHPELKKWPVIAITNIVLLALLFYFYQTVAIRVVLLLFAIVLSNHTNLFVIGPNKVEYIYHLLLNGIAKYYIANFVTLYVLSGNVTTIVSIQLFQYIFYGLYVLHIKTKLTERREGKRHFGAIAAIFNVFVSLSWLIGTIIYYLWYLNNINILGIILFSLSLLIPILYQIHFRKQYSINRLFTYLHWYLVVMSVLYGFFLII